MEVSFRIETSSNGEHWAREPAQYGSVASARRRCKDAMECDRWKYVRIVKCVETVAKTMRRNR